MNTKQTLNLRKGTKPMTKKDFQLIANAVNAEWLQNAGEGHRRACVGIANKLAQALRTTNPLFDRERFISACFSTPKKG